MGSHRNIINPALAPIDLVRGIAAGEGMTIFQCPTFSPPWPNACFIVSGVVGFSRLRSPVIREEGARTVIDRRIGVHPFQVDFHRMLSYLGTVGGKPALRYLFSDDCIEFTTGSKGA